MTVLVGLPYYFFGELFPLKRAIIPQTTQKRRKKNIYNQQLINMPKKTTQKRRKKKYLKSILYSSLRHVDI